MDEDINLLFLRGVHVSDCKSLEDAWDERINDEAEDVDGAGAPDNPVYERLPDRFTTAAAWPMTTNLLCKWCGMKPLGRPRTTPTCPQSPPPGADYKMAWDTDNVVCDGPCGAAWLTVYEMRQEAKWHRLEYLRQMEEALTGESVPPLIPAPSPYIMVQYGGQYTRAEFENEKKKLNSPLRA